MKVKDIAKEYNTTTEFVLTTLKGLKLKAKGREQELNAAVAAVLKSALNKKRGEMPPPKPAVPLVEPAAKKKTARASKAKSSSEEKPAKKKASTATETGKKTVKKAPAKKTAEKAAGKASEKTADKAEEKKPRTAKAQPAAAPEKGKAAKPVASKPKPVKVKPISDAPFVPLKPLAKKKKRPMGSARTKDESSAKSGPAPISEPAAVQPPVDRGDLPELELKVPITVKDFSVAVNQKTSAVLKKLMGMGVFANINQNLGEDVARKLAVEFGYNMAKIKTQEQQLIDLHKDEEDDPKLMTHRAPVVTFMGHVDHGKTSLLDKIRKSKITDQEHGGITQHIGAYSVNLPKGKITFLDTPGHEAFTAMRARGAHITDIVVLVVAADEGIMPQTEEAIDHSRAAGVPIVVALNKIDRRNADVDMVKKQLQQKDLTPEDWGGKTITCGVSAVTGEGIDQLLEMIILESEMLELKANADKDAMGIVVEAHLSRGKGSVASLIVQSGTLRINDFLVVGQYYGKVKAMFDDHERSIQEAGPSTPVEILGLPGVPEAGEMFYVVQDERQAREISQFRQEELKNEKLLKSSQRITLEDLYTQIQEGKIKELNVILKADVQGSLEALKDSLEKIPSDEVKVKFIHTGVGDVNASDVILAVASNAIIIGFHVGIGPKAQEDLEKTPVEVRQYRIIYDAVNDVRKALEGLLEPKLKRKFLSRIEVRQVFKLSKSGMVAGCFVTKGKVTRKAEIDVIRNGEVVHTGRIKALKRFKDDVREVNEGYECGISLENYSAIEAGDILETFEVETIARTL